MVANKKQAVSRCFKVGQNEVHIGSGADPGGMLTKQHRSEQLKIGAIADHKPFVPSICTFMSSAETSVGRPPGLCVGSVPRQGKMNTL